MQVQAINSSHQVSGIYMSSPIKVRNTQTLLSNHPNYTAVTFKEGKKGHLAIWGAELDHPVGGVATVTKDLESIQVSSEYPVPDKNSFEYLRQSNKYSALPLYNSNINYDKGAIVGVEVLKIPDKLPDNSEFAPYKGKYFYTTNSNLQNYLNAEDFFAAEDKIIQATGKPNLALDKNVFIIEDVTGGKKIIDFGDTGESEIKLFQTYMKNPKSGKLEPIHRFKIWVDLTASMKKPYDGGGYSSSNTPLAQSWKGDAYAKASYAYYKLMPRISEVCGVYPETVLCNDMQGVPLVNYLANGVAQGDKNYDNTHAAVITHNTQEGYIERTSAQNMFIDLSAGDSELRKAVEADPEFIKALKEESTEAYFKKLLPAELFDAQGKTSQFMIASYYAEQGFLPQINGVTEKYIEKAATDPDFIPALYPTLKKLYKDGKLIGINNAFENPGMNPYNLPPFIGYNQESVLGKEYQINKKDGFTIKPFKAFEKEKFNENYIDYSHASDVKRHNKISLLERFDPEVLKTLKGLKNVSGHEYDLNIAIAGAPDKNVDVLGYIDPVYVKKLEKGENVTLFTSVGRGDHQKGIDLTIEAFMKYIRETNDENAVLVTGGAFDNTSPDGKKILKLFEEIEKDPKLRGKIAHSNGFSPAPAYFMAADISMALSRYAPCELTDVESMRKASNPLVTDGQGMAQKNFDAKQVGIEKATSFKTKHEYYMSMDELKNALDQNDKTDLELKINKFRGKLSTDYSRKNNGEKLSDDQLSKMIKEDSELWQKYVNIIEPYKDKVIVNDSVELIKRAKNLSEEEQVKMWKNQLKMRTEWKTNGALSETGLSSEEKYQRYQFNRKAGKITKVETLYEKLRHNCEKIIENYRNSNKPASEQPPVSESKSWWASLSTGGKTGILATCVVVGALATYAITNAVNKHSDKNNNLTNAENEVEEPELAEIYDEEEEV